MITRMGRAWPIGGIPPIENPVRSCASLAVARRISGSDVIAASRAMSTRFGPDTRHRIGSRPPSPSGATNTRDFTICPSPAPTALAASSAVCVVASKTRTSSVTPFLVAASRTRWIEG